MMPEKTLNGLLYRKMIALGAQRLSDNRKTINDLNVFPIPDGDTGDNMYMTINTGRKAATAATGIGETAAAISSGMLLGARGNSGVILSRIFAGMAKGLEGLEEAGLEDFAAAMREGVASAYGSVPSPVEGTILTVLKDSVSKASGDSFEEYFSTLVEEMEASLDRTPDLLPVLREAGVVDSGGAGLLCIARGMAAALNGEEAEETEDGETEEHGSRVNLDDFGPDTELEFGYCTEFLLRLQTSKVDLATFDETVIRDYLTSVGESVVCFRDGSAVKVHVHTKTPGDIISHCQRWGEYLTMKIENMTLQHSEVTIQNNFVAKDEFRRTKAYGIVAVASGEGLAGAFREAGADVVIEGGQTMNPSAQDFIDAFDKVGAKTIFVLPDNSNIMMTAQQAAGMYDKAEAVVLPCKDPGAGYVTVASLDTSSGDTAAITASAVDIINSVTTGMVSVAIRDTVKDGLDIKEGDYIGFVRDEILSCGKSAGEAAVALAGRIGTGEHDAAVIFYGNGTGAEEAGELAASLQAAFPRTEFILTDGGQPVYNYIIALC